MTVPVAFTAEGLNVYQFIAVDDFADRDNDSEEGLSANRTVNICAFFVLFVLRITPIKMRVIA